MVSVKLAKNEDFINAFRELERVIRDNFQKSSENTSSVAFYETLISKDNTDMSNYLTHLRQKRNIITHKAFVYKITTDALSIDIDDDEPKLEHHIKHKFDDVKALDMHHLSYDSPQDIQVSQNNIDIFAEAAQRRASLAQAASEYLELTGQEDELDNINFRDIRLMTRVAEKMQKKPQIESKRRDESIVKPVRTTDLSKKFDLSIPVKQSLMEIQMEDEEFMYGKRGRYF